jgi:hypothetical protein
MPEVKVEKKYSVDRSDVILLGILANFVFLVAYSVMSIQSGREPGYRIFNIGFVIMVLLMGIYYILDSNL